MNYDNTLETHASLYLRFPTNFVAFPCMIHIPDNSHTDLPEIL